MKVMITNDQIIDSFIVSSHESCKRDLILLISIDEHFVGFK